MTVPELRTIEGVELARTGTYRLSTGEQTFTRDHLASAVTAAEAGAAPRLRIGHIDPRFDGDPAIGSVKNLRLDDDGDLLVGDLVDVPDWLAENLPAIYPGRSIEAKVTEDTMRLTGLALLGVTAPGIDALADLERLVAASGGTTVFASGPDAAGVDITVALPPAGETLKAAAETGTVEAVTAAWTRSRGDSWVRQVRLQPAQELIAEEYAMGNERLWRVPFSFGADGAPIFGDPTEVVVTYVDLASSNQVAAAATYNSREASLAAAGLPPEEDAVDPKALRTQLGLAEDASQEDVDAKLVELNARPTEEAVAEQVAAARKAPEGVVTVEASAFDQMKADAAAGREARDLQVKSDDEQFVAAAAEAGKFPAARSSHYVTLMQADREGTRAFIDGLEENVVPVQASGTTIEPDGDGVTDAEYAAYIKAKTGKEVTV